MPWPSIASKFITITMQISSLLLLVGAASLVAASLAFYHAQR
jgi:hypothetical protein